MCTCAAPGKKKKKEKKKLEPIFNIFAKFNSSNDYLIINLYINIIFINY